MEKTNIIWTEKTWNPVTGCEKISEGCKFCYAETIANNYSGKAFPNKFNLTLRHHKLTDPLKWKGPSLIFVNSMSDLFWNEIPEEYLNAIIDIIEKTPRHEYQVLTKRPERMLEFSRKRKLPPNFWAGITIENKRNLFRIDILREMKTEIRFVSFEPLLDDLENNYDLEDIQWVIVGGESGTHLWDEKYQKMRALVFYDRIKKKWFPKLEAIKWVESIKDKCYESGVKFFFKQWGGNYPEACGRELNGKTYNEMPRFPGKRIKIENNYLNFLEGIKSLN